MIKTTIYKQIQRVFLSLIILGTCACESSGTGHSVGRSNSGIGAITIGVTDAAVDNASEVWIQISGLTLKPANAREISFIFNSYKNVDLLSLQGALFTDLVNSELVTTGNYEWVRLHVNAELDSIFDSYIKLNDGSIHEFRIPSASQTGLKINTPFEIIENQTLNMIIDFDLRKSIVLSGKKYQMKPVLRLVNVDNTAHINGSIEPILLSTSTCTDKDPSTGNAVYLFTDKNVTPDDIDNKSPEPISSAKVILNKVSGGYEYTLGFIPFGDYTLAFTCQADQDSPNKNDNIIFSFIENITLTVTQTDLPEPPDSPPGR